MSCFSFTMATGLSACCCCFKSNCIFFPCKSLACSSAVRLACLEASSHLCSISLYS
jgi:hypothetical protein